MNMNNHDQILTITLDEMSCALPLESVIRVVRALLVTSLPKAPEIISGIVNIQGEVIPVINIRKRFKLDERETKESDRLIIADTGKRKIALFVDSIGGIVKLTEKQYVDSAESMPYADYIRGVAKINNDISLIYDLEEFLSLEEEKELDIALEDMN